MISLTDINETDNFHKGYHKEAREKNLIPKWMIQLYRQKLKNPQKLKDETIYSYVHVNFTAESGTVENGLLNPMGKPFLLSRQSWESFERIRIQMLGDFIFHMP